jgi:hypothetical protein
MRALGIFNVCYGALGLLSCLMLVYVMPTNPLPPAAVRAGGIASAWIILQGLAIIVWGPTLLATVRARVAATISFLRRR